MSMSNDVISHEERVDSLEFKKRVLEASANSLRVWPTNGRVVITRDGKKRLVESVDLLSARTLATETLWMYWRVHKIALKKLGWTISQRQSISSPLWQASLWSDAEQPSSV